jgi:hypothetical protein
MNSSSLSEDFQSFQLAVESEVFKLIKNVNQAPKELKDSFQGFVHAVNWSQPWIQYLIATHVLIYLSAIIFRNNFNVQCFLFFFVLISVYFLERINNYCNVNWKNFSDQNYFDKHGVFASVMVGAPLLTLGFLQLVVLFI